VREEALEEAAASKGLTHKLFKKVIFSSYRNPQSGPPYPGLQKSLSTYTNAKENLRLRSMRVNQGQPSQRIGFMCCKKMSTNMSISKNSSGWILVQCVLITYMNSSPDNCVNITR
jgi:hypothetical protein